MPFAPKYSPQQRDAIVRAVLDDDQTVAAAVKAAAQGELGAAFTMPLSTAYSLVADERERRRPPATPAALMQRILKLCDRDIDRIVALPELGPVERRALHQISRITRMAGSPPMAGSTRTTAVLAPGADAESTQGLAARIAARVHADEVADKVRDSRLRAAATP